MKLKQMLAAGIKVGGHGEGEEKKKAVYDRKKKGGRKNPQEIQVRFVHSFLSAKI